MEITDADLVDVPRQLKQHQRLLVRLVRPQIGFSPAEAGQPTRPGASRIGGDPDLPPGAAWPTAADGSLVPFAFQINLDQLATQFPGVLPFGPRPGLLQFYTAFVDRGGDWRRYLDQAGGHNQLVLHRDLTDLRPATGPAPVQPGQVLLPTGPPGLSLPNYLELDQPREPTDPHLELLEILDADADADDEDLDDVEDLTEDDDEDEDQEHAEDLVYVYEDWRDFGEHNNSGTLAGGYPGWLQDPAYVEAAIADAGLTPDELRPKPDTPEAAALRGRIRADAARWRLVFQVGSLCGDDGCFYLLAPLDPAGHYDLDRIRHIYQCT